MNSARNAMPSTASPTLTDGRRSRSRWTKSRRASLARLARVALALGGWAFGIGIFAYLIVRDGGLAVGVDLQAYLLAGDNLLAGRDVYWGQLGQANAFYYAPPWAVAFAALSWVPDLAMQGAMMGLGLVAIRYAVGSWLWAGLVFWYPVSIMVLQAGNIEFLIAAVMVLAARGHAGPLAFTAFAKVAPIFGVPRNGWREAALVIGVAVLVTLPWLNLWPTWIESLLSQPTQTDVHIGPPWYLRLPFALALLLLRRPWAQALAVVVAMPAFWWGSLVLLIAVIRLWLDERRGHAPEVLPAGKSD
jgi:hypothetical protein